MPKKTPPPKYNKQPHQPYIPAKIQDRERGRERERDFKARAVEARGG